MRIALIGHGSMGSIVEKGATDRGHHIAVVVDRNHDGLPAAQLAETLRCADVAIDFTVADAVRRNVEACMLAEIPLVEGTTGWNEQKPVIEKLVKEGNGAMVYGANFSIGVNLFYRVAEFAAEMFAKFPEYEAFIEEQHHSKKNDAPSGTALKLQELVSVKLAVNADEGVRIPIAATRAGKIPGTHRIGFDSTADHILLEHTARNREGFALGAVAAAEWIGNKKGFYEFTDVIGELLELG